MKNVLFIAWHDVRHQLRQGSTLLWVFVLPAVFFYFIGTVTSGFSGTMSGAKATPIVIAAKNPGFLRDQVDLRLRDNSFEPDWRDQTKTCYDNPSFRHPGNSQDRLAGQIKRPRFRPAELTAD